MQKVYSIREIENILHPVFAGYGVRRAVLFGSYAKGQATPRSDIDILVDSGLRGLVHGDRGAHRGPEMGGDNGALPAVKGDSQVGPERGIKKGTDLSRVRTLLIYSVQIPSTSLR